MDGTRKDNRTNKPFAEMKHLVVSQHIVLLSFPAPSISLFVLSLKNLPTGPNFYPVELDNIVAQLHIYVFTSVPKTCFWNSQNLSLPQGHRDCRFWMAFEYAIYKAVGGGDQGKSKDTSATVAILLEILCPALHMSQKQPTPTAVAILETSCISKRQDAEALRETKWTPTPAANAQTLRWAKPLKRSKAADVRENCSTQGLMIISSSSSLACWETKSSPVFLHQFLSCNSLVHFLPPDDLIPFCIELIVFPSPRQLLPLTMPSHDIQCSNKRKPKHWQAVIILTSILHWARKWCTVHVSCTCTRLFESACSKLREAASTWQR